MEQSIIHIALVVRDYDEAIEFYTKKLRFNLLEDTYQQAQDKRWVVVSPPGSGGTTLLLAKASKPEQLPFVGNRQVDEYFYSSTLTTFGATITRWYPAGLNLYDCLSRRRTELSLCLRTCTEIFGTSYSSLQIIQRARARPNNTMRIDRLRPIRTAATHVSATCAHSGLHEHTNRALQRRESWRSGITKVAMPLHVVADRTREKPRLLVK